MAGLLTDCTPFCRRATWPIGSSAFIFGHSAGLAAASTFRRCNEKGRQIACRPSCSSLKRGQSPLPKTEKVTVPLVVHQERAQLLAAARVTELAQRLRLDLADTLARHVELLADLFQGVV